MTQPYVNKYDKRGCSSIDYDATTLFLKLCSDRGWTVDKATKLQDTKEHWDWKLTKDNKSHLIDIKGLKRINSQDDKSDDSLLCVEYDNVEGTTGWLRGKAEFIAFLVNEGFLFVSREDLLELSKKKIDWNRKPIESPRSKRPYRVYQRSQWNRKDKFAYLRKEDVMSLQYSLWRKNA